MPSIKAETIYTGKEMIRANQGHSVDVNLCLEPVPPPSRLYHGTAEQ